MRCGSYFLPCGPRALNEPVSRFYFRSPCRSVEPVVGLPRSSPHGHLTRRLLVLYFLLCSLQPLFPDEGIKNHIIDSGIFEGLCHHTIPAPYQYLGLLGRQATCTAHSCSSLARSLRTSPTLLLPRAASTAETYPDFSFESYPASIIIGINRLRFGASALMCVLGMSLTSCVTQTA